MGHVEYEELVLIFHVMVLELWCNLQLGIQNEIVVMPQLV